MTRLITNSTAADQASAFVRQIQRWVPAHLALLLDLQSTIDWCEENYVWTEWVAEFWNTMSSLAMVLFGLYGLWRHAQFGRRFVAVFATFTIVGIGSILFHATLVFPFQLLDELPMCWTGMTMVYVITERYPRPRYSWTFPACLLLWAATVSVLTSTHGKWQVLLFQGTYVLVQVYCIYQMTRFAFRSAPTALARRSVRVARPVDIRRVYWYGVAVYALALVCWIIDFKLCHVIQGAVAHSIIPANPQLHAWWHLFAGLGSYMCCMMAVLIRAEACGWPVELAWDFKVLPYVRRSVLVGSLRPSDSPPRGKVKSG